MNYNNPTESNLIKSTYRSKLPNILVHVGAMICGVVGFSLIYFLGGVLASNVRMEFNTFKVIYLSMFFITFLVLGTLFGYFWIRSGWKLGLSLASIPVIFWSLIYLSEALSSETHFPDGVKIVHYTLPVLAGGCFGAYLGSRLKQRLKS